MAVVDRIRYVNSTAHTSGDGTTNGEGDGGTNSYVSLQAAITAEVAAHANLTDTGDGEILHIKCSAGSDNTADTTACTIDGFTTDATRYVLIEANTDEEAMVDAWKTDRYRLSVANANALTIKNNHVRVDGLQAEVTAINGNYQSPIAINSITAGNYFLISNCRLRGNNSGTNRNIGIHCNDTDIIADVYNTIVTDCNGTAGSGGIWSYATNTLNIYNSIVYNCGTDAIENITGTVTATNCSVFNNTDDFQGTITIDYCASDDGDGTNAVAPLDADWDKEYVDPASGDFTPVAGGNTADGGTNDPGDPLYDTGMDGVSYVTDSWSIGVVQSVAAGGANITGIYYRTLLQGGG